MFSTRGKITSFLKRIDEAKHLKQGVAANHLEVEVASIRMVRIQSRDLAEAEELLAEVASWPEERVERLPKFYQEKAQEYRRLANGGED